MADGNRGQDQNQAQDQNQSQTTAVTINLRSSGDPQLEDKILNGDYGVGRQLGTLAAVIEVLLAAHENVPLPADADSAIAKFKKTQADIGRVKRLRKATQLLEGLERPSVSVAASQELCRGLRAWLDEYERDLVAPGPDGVTPVSPSGSPAAP